VNLLLLDLGVEINYALSVRARINYALPETLGRDDPAGHLYEFFLYQSMVFFNPSLKPTWAVKPKASFALSVSKQRRG
jgi:hypothetical protein